MARRLRTSLHPLWFLGIGIFLVGIFGGGAWLLLQTGEPYRTAAPLEVEAYLENSNSLRGNTYRVTGEVLNVLGYSPTEGRLIAVRVSETDDIVPMLIPPSLGHHNIQRGQNFAFLLDVADNGILEARDLTKT